MCLQIVVVLNFIPVVSEKIFRYKFIISPKQSKFSITIEEMTTGKVEIPFITVNVVCLQVQPSALCFHTMSISILFFFFPPFISGMNQCNVISGILITNNKENRQKNLIGFINPAYYASILNKTIYRKISDIFLICQNIFEIVFSLFIISKCQSCNTIIPTLTSKANLNKVVKYCGTLCM